MELLKSHAVDIPPAERVLAMRNMLAPQIRDNVLCLTAKRFGEDFEKTLVYAVLCTGYGESEYEIDVQTVARRYKVPTTGLLRYVIKGSDLVPDEDVAFRDISKIIKMLNNPNDRESSETGDSASSTVLQSATGVDPVRRLRIVEAGFKKTGLITDVLRHMLKNWTSQGNENRKSVQFIHVREDSEMLLFWKEACLKGLCGDVEFVNRRDYTALGTLE